MDSILKIENLTISFGGIKALNGVSFEVEKVYVVRLAEPADAETMRRLSRGVMLEDGMARPVEVKSLTRDRRVLELSMKEGKKREIVCNEQPRDLHSRIKPCLFQIFPVENKLCHFCVPAKPYIICKVFYNLLVAFKCAVGIGLQLAAQISPRSKLRPISESQGIPLLQLPKPALFNFDIFSLFHGFGMAVV
jgi:hypothetical protein